jgi:stage II sporulation protein D
VEKPTVTAELPIEEDEVAAAIGAVIYLLAEESSSRQDSVWAKVSRLEATSGSSIASPQDAALLDAPYRSVRPWQGRNHACVGLIGLSLSLFLWTVGASPASAWWIFKHHHHDSDQTNESQQSSANPSPPVVSQPIPPSDYLNSWHKHRLMPRAATGDLSRPVQPPPSNGSAMTFPGGIPTAPDRQATIVIGQSKLKTTTIRIGLATGTSAAEIVALDGAALRDYASGTNIATLAPQTRWSVKLDRKCLVMSPKDWFQLAYGSGRELQSGSYGTSDSHIRPAAYRVSDVPRFDTRSFNRAALRVSLGTFSDYKSVVLVPNSADGQPGLFAVNGKFYRGNLIILPQSDGSDTAVTSSSFNLINELDLDDYLLGVVPAEMPSSWPLEALKAQAIAARTYAYANLGKHGKDGYDMKDTTDDQVYSGVKAESTASNAAVSATGGVVMTYEGNPICAYFHSASGGITESSENVWGRPLPYLRAVMDYDQQSPLATWNRTFSVDQIESALASDVGRLLSIDVVSRSQSRRACHLLVVGTRGAQITNAETVRRVLKLPSTNFNVSVLDNAYLFSGRGFGHGLGLSQWGAKGLAEQGYNAAQILTYYYRNVSLERLVDVPNH